MTTDKWQMNRAGLLNFWYYDEEIFDFSDGKLLLRGSNGSGKSVTMQSLLPVLLDGRKSPDRLDPFGSKARKMEDYLLGEKEIVDRDERTGYLFIEYKRKHTNQYVTTGIGLQAKRNRPMKFWGFVITDNRRVGIDIELYKTERQGDEVHKIPRSRVELETLIADGGQVVQTQGDYMRLVNKHIFGFESIEAYEDLIKLLIQLRSPKLSKDFKPTVIYEILEAALPPLTDDDLRHLSDTIEQMDQTKQQIEQLERELIALGKLTAVYSTYNERLIADLAIEYRKSVKKHRKELQLWNQLNEEQAQLQTEIGQLQEDIRQLEQDYDVLEKQRQRLSSHEIWNIEEERKKESERLEVAEKDQVRKESKLNELKRKRRSLEERKDETELLYSELQSSIEDHVGQMALDAAEAAFERHALNEADFRRIQQSERFDFSVWKKEAENHSAAITVAMEKLQQYEQLKVNIESKQKEMADVQFKRDLKKQEEEEWNRTFEEDKETHLHRIYAWAESNTQFEFSEQLLQKASRAVYGLYKESDYEDVRRPFQEAIQRYTDQLREQRSVQHAELNRLQAAVDLKQGELELWKNKKDPEPDTDSTTIETRKLLKEQGIAFSPFYALVEFQEHVSETLQRRIEATLLDTGLLDSLVTEAKIAVKHDRIIRPNPQIMAHTLADYLQPDRAAETNVPKHIVEAVLQSIVIGTEAKSSSMTMDEHGSYRIGLVEGHAVPVDQVRFIGRNARKRYQQEQIERIVAELEELETAQHRVRSDIQKLDESIDDTREAWKHFPHDRDLQLIEQQIQKVRMQIEMHDVQLSSLSEQLKELDIEFQAMKRAVQEATQAFVLELSYEAYREAKRVMEHYEKAILSLETLHQNAFNESHNIVDFEERLQEMAKEWDIEKGELNVLEDDIERLRKNIARIEEQLTQAGVADIRQQIREVQSKLDHVAGELRVKSQTLPTKQAQSEHTKEKQAQQQRIVHFCEQMKQAWAKSLEGELQRRFVLKDMDDISLDEIARQLEKSFGQLVKDKDKGTLESQLMSQFYGQHADLMEYRMREYVAPAERLEWMKTLDADEYAVTIEQWEQKTTRRLIDLDWRGQKVSPYFVYDQLLAEQERQQHLLLDQDKQLYEEILFKSVGNKLRSRIRRAEKWTRQMADLMESRDTSSGLSFSIRWRPRTAETEEELDTKDLVDILKQDAQLLKEQDLERITTHFRSRIQSAKKWMEEKGEGETLLQVLKEVLDYRKWFSFELYYERTNEPKRELTNNKFYTFSGGEKAMAMYIPLFTACYSRYLEAADTAPYIISLDEAFAGVDENNIREMFQVVEQLGFDYIMNSQVLWGDYDTISSLSICELIRPKNADVVSVIRYQWDGHKLALEVEDNLREMSVSE